MHEMALIDNLFKKIDSLAREHQAAGVASVTVRLGAWSHISADHFREHFEQGSRGSISEGAQLVIKEPKDPSDPHAQDIFLESVEFTFAK